MKEKLIIENFCGIKHFELPINRINLLIGPQATGKSVCAKLLYFFKGFEGEVFSAVENEKSTGELVKIIVSKFFNIFPKNTFTKGSFSLRYELDNNIIKIDSDKKQGIKLTYSEYYKKEFEDYKSEFKKLKEKFNKEVQQFIILGELRQKFFENKRTKHEQLFIPAARSYFSILQTNIYSFISNNITLDPLMIEFGKNYAYTKFFYDRFIKNEKIDELVKKILVGTYFHENEKDYLIHDDGRKVEITYSSSGQQEALPLVQMLRSIFEMPFFLDTTIYIEEPEAHLFPSAQKDIVELISYIFNASNANPQFFITTHSPYILSAFNNLMYAGELEGKLSENKKKKLYKVIPKEFIINPADLNAHSLSYDECKNIIDPDINLVNTNYLDEVSDDFALQFDKLLKLE